jgi:hypothetical protein
MLLSSLLAPMVLARVGLVSNSRLFAFTRRDMTT